MTLSERIIEVIDEYIEPESHVLALERIHRNVFRENKNFSGFDEAREEYRKRDWTRIEVRNFVGVSKRVVESRKGRISETYFSIVKPENPSLETIKKELERVTYNPDATGEEIAGFEYEEEDGIIDGRYVYVDVDTHVSYSGRVDERVDEGAIEFRINPEKDLLILESTGVIDVQKTKSIFNKKTELDLIVTADLTRLNDHEAAAERIDAFRNSFADPDDDEDPDASIPVMLEVVDIKLERPKGDEVDEEEQILTNIDFEGTDIATHPTVVEQINEGWIIKRIEAKVRYQNEVFTVTVAGTSVMGYAKVSEFKSRPKARELMDLVRVRFLKHIA